jgi:hypothetical protein
MELFSSRLKLRLIDNADLNAIHILHSLAETDEFNAWNSKILALAA